MLGFFEVFSEESGDPRIALWICFCVCFRPPQRLLGGCNPELSQGHPGMGSEPRFCVVRGKNVIGAIALRPVALDLPLQNAETGLADCRNMNCRGSISSNIHHFACEERELCWLRIREMRDQRRKNADASAIQKPDSIPDLLVRSTGSQVLNTLLMSPIRATTQEGNQNRTNERQCKSR